MNCLTLTYVRTRTDKEKKKKTTLSESSGIVALYRVMVFPAGAATAAKRNRWGSVWSCYKTHGTLVNFNSDYSNFVSGATLTFGVCYGFILAYAPPNRPPPRSAFDLID